jgi:ubiquinone biosynthesis protein
MTESTKCADYRTMRGRNLPIVFVTRTAKLAGLTLWYTLKLLFVTPFGRTTAPVVLREYLQRCGAGFVKLGQFLSMRYDILPNRYCEELRKLLDAMSPVPAEQIIEVVVSALNDPRKHGERRQLSDIFASFDKKPIAAASIAQVHAAELPNGLPVAVKVMRPGIKNKFRTDLTYLRIFAWLFDCFGLLPNGNLSRMASEVKRFTFEELDFRREARNIAHLHKLMNEDDVDHYTPQVFFEYSGPEVITMERIKGLRLKDLVQAADANDEQRLSEWHKRGITPQRTARTLLLSVLIQTIRHKAFQADPHEGNIFVLDGSVIAWVDLGMLGWLDEVVLLQQLRLRKAIVEERIHAAYESFLETLEPIPAGDHSRFEFAVKGIIRDWLIALKNDYATPEEKSSGRLMINLLQAVRREKMTAPNHLVLLYRAIITADSIVLKLDPHIDSLAILRTVVEEETLKQIKEAASHAVSPSSMSMAAQTMLRVPNAFVTLMDRFQRHPEFFRMRKNELIGFKRGFLNILRALQVAVVLATILLLLAHFLEGPFSSATSRIAIAAARPLGAIWLVELVQYLKSHWLFALISGFIIVVLFGHLINTIESADR